MRFGYNKYISLIIILLAVSAAGFTRAHRIASSVHPHAVHTAQSPRYKDPVIIARHRTHPAGGSRHRFNLDGFLPVQQDPVHPTETGAYAVTPVQNQHFPIPATPSLRGPPAA